MQGSVGSATQEMLLAYNENNDESIKLAELSAKMLTKGISKKVSRLSDSRTPMCFQNIRLKTSEDTNEVHE